VNRSLHRTGHDCFWLARCSTTPLLVLDHLDDELGENGRTQVRDLLVDYPGIVVLASETPDAVVTPTRT
jgi:hypothetical protein